ncbi:unnamed protein product, partial [Meganyctiphanes norvegica]
MAPVLATTLALSTLLLKTSLGSPLGNPLRFITSSRLNFENYYPGTNSDILNNESRFPVVQNEIDIDNENIIPEYSYSMKQENRSIESRTSYHIQSLCPKCILPALESARNKKSPLEQMTVSDRNITEEIRKRRLEMVKAKLLEKLHLSEPPKASIRRVDLPRVLREGLLPGEETQPPPFVSPPQPLASTILVPTK